MYMFDILEQVKKEVGMSAEVEICRISNKYLYDDGYITIMASEEDDVNIWALSHKLIVAQIYTLLKYGSDKNTLKSKNEYDKIIRQKLKLCHREPEIDIFFSKKYDNLSVVAYTDDINMIIKESNTIKGVA